MDFKNSIQLSRKHFEQTISEPKRRRCDFVEDVSSETAEFENPAIKLLLAKLEFRLKLIMLM